jgi:hypothetical protein
LKFPYNNFRNQKSKQIMANSKLLKQAIADAKAVKETALANAKLALEEAFTPRLQSILSQKLRAEAEMSDDEDEMKNEELDSSEIGASDMKEPDGFDANTEFEGGSTETESGEPGSELDDYSKVKDLTEEEGMEDDDMDFGDDDMEDDDMDFGDEGMEDESDEEYEITGDEEETSDDDEDMDLESIIRELESQLGEEEVTDDEEPADDMAMESLADGEEAGTDKGEDPKVVVSEEEDGDDETIDLEEILREMEADMADSGDDEMEKQMEENKKLKSELNQAYSAIKSLQGTINEVNLLNAKLLFANKLFRAHNMTNEQKVKVIETLDRTKSVREVKLVYSTLAENFKYTSVSKVAKKAIAEGIASRPVKSTKPSAAKQVIAESADFSDRFKKLAGIIK